MQLQDNGSSLQLFLIKIRAHLQYHALYLQQGHLYHRVTAGVLHRMARFMAGNADGGDGGAVIHAVGQANDIGLGVKMVRQVTTNTLHPHAGHTVDAKHSLGSLRTGDAAIGQHLGIFFKGGIDAGAGPKG